MTNLFAGISEHLAAEQADAIVEAGGLRLERIVSTGHATPPGQWHDQDTTEWVAVLTGSAGLRFEDDDTVRVMHRGDHVVIPAHRRHRVEWTDRDRPTVWLALHYEGEREALKKSTSRIG